MLLLSVLPYKAFSRFLHKQHPEMVPYLQMVHLCKLTQEDQEMLQELKEIQQEKSEQVGMDYQNKKLLADYQKITQEVT